MRLPQRSLRKRSLSFRPTLEALEDRITPVVISNGIPAGTPGEFKVDVLTAGDLGTFNGSNSQFTFTTAVPGVNPYTANVIYEYETYYNIGAGGVALDTTHIDQPATLVGSTVVSKGHFTGSAGQTINWISTDSLGGAGQQLNDQLTFNTANGSGLGTLKVYQYLDQDIQPGNFATDLLVPRGTVAANNLLLFTINAAYRVGFAQGGPYLPSAMQNTTFLGWAGDTYDTLESNIQAGTQGFSTTGTIALADLPASVDPILHQTVYGAPGSDVTNAMAWVVNPTSPSASFTPYIQGVPTQVGLPVIVTDIPTLTVGAPYSTTLAAEFGTPFAGSPGYKFAVTAGALPPGLALNGTTGLLGGTPTTAGTYNFTLSATDSVNAVGTRAYTVVVDQTPASLQFKQQPSNTTAGQVIDGLLVPPAVTVQIYDKFGNPLAVAGDPVVMSLYSGTGTLLGTLTQTTDATGLATFSNLSIKIAGVKMLKASTGSGASLISTLSSPFTITADVANQLVFTQQPTNTFLNGIINQSSGGVKVQLEDQYGNLVAQAGTAITMSLKTGTGPISGTLTQNTDVNGVATFNDLNFAIGLSGFKTIQVTGAGLGTTVSNQFEITGPVTQFALSTPGYNIAVNRQYTITLTAEDANGLPTLLPQTVSNPTVSFPSAKVPSQYVIGGTSILLTSGTISKGFTGLSFTRTSTGFTFTFMARTAGAATIKFSDLFNYPGVTTSNATGSWSFFAS